MSSKLIAKLPEPMINANFLICKSGEKGVFLTKNEYLDANGKVEATSVGWSRVGTLQLRSILTGHFHLSYDEADSILAA